MATKKKPSLKNISRLIASASQQLPPQEGFLKDLNLAIERIDKMEQRKPSQAYKPSSMNCIRNMYYQVTGMEVDTSNQSGYCLIGICESGTDRHERLQNYIGRMAELGFNCEWVDVGEYVKSRGLTDIEVIEKKGNETKLYHKGLNISFLCDGIIKYKGRYYILEIKTETVFNFQMRDSVNPKHVKQATTYCLCLGIDEVIFLYESRDNCDKKAFLFVPSDDEKMDVVSTIEQCDQYVKSLTVPKKPENINKKICQYCDYKERCKKDGK